MVKNLALVLLTLTFSTYAECQVWIDNGATWHYDFWNVATEGFYEYKYTGDTLIDSHECQKIVGSRYAYGLSGPDFEPAFFGQSDLGTHYTYVSGDTVFYRNNEEFFVLFDFGATAGDSWIISTTTFEICGDTSYVYVTETGTITIGGETYRTITLETDADASYGIEGVFCERFGNISGGGPFTDLFPHEFECDSLTDVMVIEWDMSTFKCYEDDSFELYNPSGEDCDWWRVNLGVKTEEKADLGIYPNPATDFIFIDGIISESQYEILNLNGQIVQTGEITTNKVAINSLNSGVYFIQMSGAVRRFMVK